VAGSPGNIVDCIGTIKGDGNIDHDYAISGLARLYETARRKFTTRQPAQRYCSFPMAKQWLCIKSRADALGSRDPPKLMRDLAAGAGSFACTPGAESCTTLGVRWVPLEIIRRGEPYDHPPLASLSTASWAGRGGGIARCCALAVKGEVIAAPPNSVMNSRRFIQFLVMLRGWNDQAGQ
jgi:hypothetical protein